MVRYFLLVGILALLVGIFLQYVPIFTLREIYVFGNTKLQDEDVIRLSALEIGSNLFSLKIRQPRECIKVSPWVKEVSLKKAWPDKLYIEVQERTPYFLVPYYTTFLLAAEDGTILCPAPDRLDNIPLPILTGVQIEDPVLPGQTLHCLVWDNLIDVVKGFPPDFPEKIVEVHLSPDQELVLYTAGGIQILFGQAVDITRKITLIGETCREIDSPIETINVRGGERVHVSLKHFHPLIGPAVSPQSD
jgi:cell division protein FtsQ